MAVLGDIVLQKFSTRLTQSIRAASEYTLSTFVNEAVCRRPIDQ